MSSAAAFGMRRRRLGGPWCCGGREWRVSEKGKEGDAANKHRPATWTAFDVATGLDLTFVACAHTRQNDGARTPMRERGHLGLCDALHV